MDEGRSATVRSVGIGVVTDGSLGEQRGRRQPQSLLGSGSGGSPEVALDEVRHEIVQRGDKRGFSLGAYASSAADALDRGLEPLGHPRVLVGLLRAVRLGCHLL